MKSKNYPLKGSKVSNFANDPISILTICYGISYAGDTAAYLDDTPLKEDDPAATYIIMDHLRRSTRKPIKDEPIKTVQDELQETNYINACRAWVDGQMKSSKRERETRAFTEIKGELDHFESRLAKAGAKLPAENNVEMLLKPLNALVKNSYYEHMKKEFPAKYLKDKGPDLFSSVSPSNKTSAPGMLAKRPTLFAGETYKSKTLFSQTDADRITKMMSLEAGIRVEHISWIDFDQEKVLKDANRLLLKCQRIINSLGRFQYRGRADTKQNLAYLTEAIQLTGEYMSALSSDKSQTKLVSDLAAYQQELGAAEAELKRK